MARPGAVTGALNPEEAALNLGRWVGARVTSAVCVRPPPTFGTPGLRTTRPRTMGLVRASAPALLPTDGEANYSDPDSDFGESKNFFNCFVFVGVPSGDTEFLSGLLWVCWC